MKARDYNLKGEEEAGLAGEEGPSEAKPAGDVGLVVAEPAEAKPTDSKLEPWVSHARS